MRRWLIGGAAALALVAGGGAALWWWGAGRIEREMDARVAALRDRAAIEWGAREISGFPLGYVLTLRDVEVAAPDGAWRFAAPWVEVAMEAVSPRVAVATLAPTASLSLTPPEGGPLDLAMEHEALVVESRFENERIESRLTADRLAFATAEDAARRGRLEALASDLTHITGAPGVHILGGDVGRLTLDYAADLPQGRRVEGTARLDQAHVEGRGTGLDAGSVAAFVAAPGAAAELAVQAAGLEATTERRIAPDAAAFRESLATGPNGFRLALGEGRLAYAAETEAARYAGRLPGPVRAERVAAAIETPTLPAEAPQPWTARLAVEGAEPEAAFWAALDPEGALPRDPATLLLELRGEAEATRPVAAVGPDAPIRTRTIEIRRAELEALGAEAEATGRFVMPEGGGAPEGAMTVRAEGLDPLVENLAEAGLLTREQRMLVETLIRLYARPADELGVVAAEIELRDGGVFANGQRLR